MSTPTSQRVSGGRGDAAPRPAPPAPPPPPPPPGPTPTAPTPTATLPAFDAQRAWKLNPSVALRPEPFGALLYHFGTRKLSFLKNLTVVALVQSLGEHASGEAALAAADLGSGSRHQYVQALDALARSGMIIARDE